MSLTTSGPVSDRSRAVMELVEAVLAAREESLSAAAAPAAQEGVAGVYRRQQQADFRQRARWLAEDWCRVEAQLEYAAGTLQALEARREAGR